MTHQFGHETGGFGGMYGWPQGGWASTQTPIGATGQGMGFGGEQTAQLPWQGGPFTQMGQLPWTGMGMGMGMPQPFGGQFGGFGFTPWHFFWQIENFLKQHPQMHYLHHQMLGNLLLSAPMQHYFPWMAMGYFPWQQTTGFGGFSGMQQPLGGFSGAGMMPWQQQFGGFGGGMGSFGMTPWQGMGTFGFGGPFPWQQFGGFGGGMGQQFPWQQGGRFGGGMGRQAGGFAGEKLTDEQITDMLYDCIEADPMIPSETDFTLECRDGVVTINGTCHNKWVKHRIGEYCWWMPGVMDVNNQMRVITRRQEQAARGGQPRAEKTGVTSGAGTRS